MTKAERRLKWMSIKRYYWEVAVALVAFTLVLLAIVYFVGWVLAQAGVL